MEKYKVCPSCGTKNAPHLLECQECETDITGVKLVDEMPDQAVKKENIPHDMLEYQMVRICECGICNHSQARKCSGCGEDISDTQPISITEKNTYSLVSLDGSYVFKIIKPMHIIGREIEMGEYLHAKPYVSRIHAKLTLMENKLYITNESRTNFTFVNNEKIEDAVPRLLKDGDEIGLGGIKKDECYQEKAAYFLVRKCSC